MFDGGHDLVQVIDGFLHLPDIVQLRLVTRTGVICRIHEKLCHHRVQHSEFRHEVMYLDLERFPLHFIHVLALDLGELPDQPTQASQIPQYSADLFTESKVFVGNKEDPVLF
jgi:hypothetical protein